MSKCTQMSNLFPFLNVCACVCLCLLLRVHSQQKVGTETDKPLCTMWECMFMCHFVCMHVCQCACVCVSLNDLFWWSTVADIEMDGPYALYGPCIFHISAAKQSRAGIAYMARMLHWDVGWLYESSYTHPTAFCPLWINVQVRINTTHFITLSERHLHIYKTLMSCIEYQILNGLVATHCMIHCWCHKVRVCMSHVAKDSSWVKVITGSIHVNKR